MPSTNIPGISLDLHGSSMFLTDTPCITWDITLETMFLLRIEAREDENENDLSLDLRIEFSTQKGSVCRACQLWNTLNLKFQM